MKAKEESHIQTRRVTNQEWPLIAEALLNRVENNGRKFLMTTTGLSFMTLPLIDSDHPDCITLPPFMTPEIDVTFGIFYVNTVHIYVEIIWRPCPCGLHLWATDDPSAVEYVKSKMKIGKEN